MKKDARLEPPLQRRRRLDTERKVVQGQRARPGLGSAGHAGGAFSLTYIHEA